MPTRPRIAVIGAGPIGLEAALYARLQGYDVTVYERGDVADHVRQWGHVRMFSPFGMNSSEWGRDALVSGGQTLPDREALLTGSEFIENYLKPLSELPIIRSAINERALVASITRRGLLKTEAIGLAGRTASPFALRGGHRHQSWFPEADCILDCTGTMGRPQGWGLGGLEPPWAGAERSLPDVDGQDRTKYLGKQTLVVGSGHSAATSVVALARLADDDSATRVTWVTRRHRDVPIPRISDDRLPARDALAEAANRLAIESPSPVEWLRGYEVRTCDIESATRKHVVEFDDTTTGETLPARHFDRIIANVGYRPDRSLYEELQIHECYATQGPMKLAAKLLGETSVDCLDQTSHGPAVLRNPEPNFYILGMKSYGRSSNFLIQVGLQQIADVFSLIKQDWGL